jgi:hypothetical protein
MIVDGTSSRFVSANDTQSVAVSDSGTTITGDSGHNVTVTSSTTTINGTASIYSGNGTGNSLVVGDTQEETVGLNTLNYGTYVDGGMLIDGDLGVNGNIYTLNDTANATVNVANNGLSITGSTNTVALQADNDSSSSNALAKLTLTPTSASMLVNTDDGESHGVTVTQTSTIISGGTTSSQLTLDDNGAAFADQDTGAPIKVTGVDYGTSTYDAVNYGQFSHEVKRLDDRIDDAYSGIASVAAIAAVPSPIDGKNVSFGFGFGNYKSESAIAIGTKARVGKNKDWSVTAGVGYSGNKATISAGLGWSF